MKVTKLVGVRENIGRGRRRAEGFVSRLRPWLQDDIYDGRECPLQCSPETIAMLQRIEGVEVRM